MKSEVRIEFTGKDIKNGITWSMCVSEQSHRQNDAAVSPAAQRHYSILETSSLVSFPLTRPWSVDLGPVGGFSAGRGRDVQVARADARLRQAQSNVPRPCPRPFNGLDLTNPALNLAGPDHPIISKNQSWSNRGAQGCHITSRDVTSNAEILHHGRDIMRAQFEQGQLPEYALTVGVWNCQVPCEVVESQLFTYLWNRYHQPFSDIELFQMNIFFSLSSQD